MSRRALALALLLLAPGAARPVPLPEALAATLETKALHGARVGALVVEAASGRTLFEHDPDRALVPASNLKILTALAALEGFGPTHRFTTRVFADAAPDADGAVDVLYLCGGGDPSLTSEAWWRLAADLRLAGLRAVRGGIVVDDAAFDGQRWHESWGKVTSRAYYAPIGALTANYGAFTVEATAGARPGEPVTVTLDPPVDYLHLLNRARTDDAASGDHLRVDRVSAGGSDEVRVGGRLAAGSGTRRLYRSVSDPGLYAGAVAALQLAANGVQLAGSVRRGAVPEGAHELLAYEGLPLAEIVRLLIKYSNNAIAESLVKALAVQATTGPGAWSAGSAAVLSQLAALGVPTDGIRLVDGSGLSRENRVTARTLVRALRVARASFQLGPELLAALPIAGRDGTLRKRAEGAADRVRAKTGLLEQVTSLSGYAELADGTPVVFSLLVNGYRSSDGAAMDAVDAFAAALVGSEPPAAAVSRSAAWVP
jgi:D-alanyl-D-alanine carboxypeptidase/D-alanyl-D-alanine-endopeptidase (penicillin-binding protein 4)